LEDLQALREQLSVWLVEAPVDRKAALVAQYRATIAEIDELEPKEAVGDGIDQIAERRAARRTGPAKGASSAKRTS
jgi:hypothetical protein